jgi:hypothetical protein
MFKALGSIAGNEKNKEKIMMMNVTGYSEHAMGWLVMRKEIQ